MNRFGLWAAVLALVAGSAGARAEPLNLTLCAASVGGTWSLIGAGIDAAVKKTYPGSVVTIQTSQGGIANAASLQTHNCDIAIMHSPEVAMALEGKEPFRKPMPNLRLLARIESWSPMHIMVTEEAAKKYNLKTTADIAKAKPPLRIVLQKPGNIGYQVARDILARSGVTIEDLKSWGGDILYAASAEQANLMRDRRADLAMNILFPGAAQVLDVDQGVPITLLSVPDNIAKEVSKAWSVPVFVIPANTYDFIDHDIETVTLGAHLVTLDTLPDTTVKEILTAITDNGSEIALVHPSMKRLDIRQYSGSTLPYHKAAIEFYKSRGMMPTN